jgi:ATP-dependent Lhr-like helicase
VRAHDEGRSNGELLGLFGDATRAWFEQSFPGATQVQRDGWPVIASGDHALLLAPTGSGKTLAAFLWSIDRLSRAVDEDREPGVRVLYISPLKALAYDVERNLRAPLTGIVRAAERVGVEIAQPQVAIRSGDTSQRERRIQARRPSDILVTTPESLYLILGSQARETLRTVETVIVDEVHALAPTKRGAHLALSLERLAALTATDPQRIGLSATARPVEEVAGFVGGDRPVSIVDTTAPPRIDLEVRVPVVDMTRPELRRRKEDRERAAEPDGFDEDDPATWFPDGESNASGQGAPDRADAIARPAERQYGIWPALVPQLYQLIESHRTTIVFVNNRARSERLVAELNELAGESLVRPHHGSLAQAQRRDTEEALKAGQIRGIVATSSLELGIDMGSVDLVVLVESPGAVSRGLQRVGRAGHGVGQTSKGRLFPKHRGDLLEAAVVAAGMRDGAIEPLRVPQNTLDVLAQHLVAMCAVESWRVDDAERTLRRAYGFRDLPRDGYVAVLDMLSGRYPSTAFADLKPRLTWDRDSDVLSARRGARTLAAVSGGTIPDRGLYGVYLGEEGPRVGELDEEMVHETQPGHVVTLGASSWRVEQITRDRVIVTPAPGEVGRMPFWRGDGPGRPIELGRALGAFSRQLGELGADEARARLERDYQLDPFAAENLLAYLREQREATGTVPTDRAITVERFRDELGDWRICILTPFGALVHAPWALAVQAGLSAETGFDVQAMWSDDGICLRLSDSDESFEQVELFPDPDEVEQLVVDQLGHSALFASHFRENAARALLLPRRRPGARTPLWQQRLRSQQLLGVARGFPSFPIVIETYRECLQDVFDLPSLIELLRRVQQRDVRVDDVQTSAASPFARSLVFAYVATYLYEQDAPLAERRAQALSLDRELLRDLLGQQDLRELLDEDAIAEVEAELGHLVDERKARHADELHDLLRRLGALTTAEIALRSAETPTAWVEELGASRRIVEVVIGGEPMLCVVEDAALYRDALGTALPAGIPEAYLTAVDRPLEQLVARAAKTRGPFVASAIADRHGLAPAAVEAVLRLLEAEGRVVRGGFLPGGRSHEWCDVDVLRRIKRRTLAKLRGDVEPVDRAVFARFLPAWHGIGSGAKGKAALEEAITKLEGMPLSYAALEKAILPARVADFRPSMLDELGTMGFVVWVGCGALGSRDGKVALYRRERIATLLQPPEPDDSLSATAGRLLALLEERGACFFVELESACHSRDGEPAPTHDELVDALWELVWAGLVTNDTLQPLHALGLRRASQRTRRRGTDLRVAGRWSLVRSLVSAAAEPTARAHARALMLLERHGIVSRAAASLEALPGGFSAVYPVLGAMEEAGKVRRGYFVDGIGGAQFAFGGAVDRLRAARHGDDQGAVTVISAADPANPFGWVLPWPDRRTAEAHEPRRNLGALVVSVDGAPALYLEKGGHKLLTFAPPDSAAIRRAIEALRDQLARHRGRSVRIDGVDGQPALTSPLAPAFREAGLPWDHRGFFVEKAV